MKKYTYFNGMPWISIDPILFVCVSMGKSPRLALQKTLSRIWNTLQTSGVDIKHGKLQGISYYC